MKTRTIVVTIVCTILVCLTTLIAVAMMNEGAQQQYDHTNCVTLAEVNTLIANSHNSLIELMIATNDIQSELMIGNLELCKYQHTVSSDKIITLSENFSALLDIVIDINAELARLLGN